MAQVANASSEVLSSVAAVADFGFRETLGSLNVHGGTEIHRFVLKACGSRLTDGLQEAVREALLCEFNNPGEQCDAMHSLRRVTLHATVLHMLGKQVLNEYSKSRDFLSDFMCFQDLVEDATAKGVVLPEWIATWFVWRPVRLERAKIVARLQRALEVTRGGEQGWWLNSVGKLKSYADVPALKHMQRGRQCEGSEVLDFSGPVSASDTAELIVGLLFAAHKNPAIGAAQTLLFLLEQPEHMQEVQSELAVGAPAGKLALSIKESLRLTAHTLGGLRKVVAPEGFNLKTSQESSFHVPCGEYIGLSHSLPNSDSDTFANPTSFEPGRFHGRSFDDYEFTTFGQGRHLCPGRQYAERLMELILSELLRRFEFKVEGSLPPPCYERATLAQRAGPCHLRYRAV